jgi:hypothetical protein
MNRGAVPTPSFQLPRDGLTYIQDISARCRSLIDRDVWRDLDVARFRRWMANFRTNEEKYFAACVLDGLMYRSKDQTLALIKHMLQRTLPDLMRLDPPGVPTPTDWPAALAVPGRRGDPGVRLVTAVTQSDPPTKSAHHVGRLLKRHFSVSEDWIIKAWDIGDHFSRGVRIFIFIDDFLGTGDQFEKFYNVENIISHSGIYAAYVPLVAHAGGIAYLKQHLPIVRVKSVELLTESHAFFHVASKSFEDGINTPDLARSFYYDLLGNRGINLTTSDRGGFGGLELAYIFEHAAPDNCLPILWWRHSSLWTPLFDR